MRGVQQKNIDKLNNVFTEKREQLGDKTYAEGKWSVKDILQQIIVMERTFCCLALAFSGGEKVYLPSVVKVDYADNANANLPTAKEHPSGLNLVHKSTQLIHQ